MNETILCSIIAYVTGIVSCLFFRWLYDRSQKNRLGTDSNVVEQVTDRNENVANSLDECNKRLEDITNTAGELENIVRNYKTRE